MKRINWLELFVAAGLALGVSLVAAPAAAAPEFPKKIKEALSLSYEIPCEACHENGNAGIGTLRTPLGLTVRSYAVSPDDPQTMVDALTKMKADRTDSDGDGKLDVDELTGNPTATPPVPPSNPNMRAPGDAPWPPANVPNTGCATSSTGAGTDPSSWLSGLAAGVVVGFFALRRRRR
jgi:MYXO-CTERM domain-containing protein